MASAMRKLTDVVRIGRRSIKKYTFNSNNSSENTTPAESPKREVGIVQVNPLVLDEKCIRKSGYLVKSPSKSGLKRRIGKWQFRWFVLYDTQPQCELNESCKRQVILYYFRSHQEHLNNAQPIGQISLRGARIFAQAKRLRGYQYVINIVTSSRCFHLCATQHVVFDEWLQGLKYHLDDPDFKPPDEDDYDDGYHTWEKTNGVHTLKQDGSKKKKKLTNQMMIQQDIEENSIIESPSQMEESFRQASSFLLPTDDSVMSFPEETPSPLTRRERANTSALLFMEEDKLGSSWDVSGFTGPTTVFNRSSGLAGTRPKSCSMSMLSQPHDINRNRNQSCKTMVTVNELSSSSKEVLQQRNSLRPCILRI